MKARDTDPEGSESGSVKGREKLQNLLLVVVAVLSSGVLLEVGWLLYGLFAPPPTPWPPGITLTLETLPGITPGIHGPSVFSVSSLGVRSREPAKDDRFRVLCTGGSTTECAFLDDSEAWPSLLEQHLGGISQGVWVGNAGLSGMSLSGQVQRLDDWLDGWPPMDLLVVLSGVNDLAWRLQQGDEYLPRKPPSLWQRSALGTLWSRLTGLGTAPADLGHGLKSQLPPPGQSLAIPAANRIYLRWRQRRAQASATISRLPDLKRALEEYEAALHATIDTASRRSMKVCFLTQPTLWKEDMPPEEEKLLWFGWAGSRDEETGPYYSAGTLAQGMKQYNDVLRAVCRRRNAPCIDLAARLPKNTSVFYDDCHFNEEGARQVARLVAEGLKEEMRIGDRRGRD